MKLVILPLVVLTIRLPSLFHAAYKSILFQIFLSHMKAATSVAAATKYFQKTVSGTKKYVVAPDFHQKMVQLKQSAPSPTSEINMPSRFALRRHEYFLNLPVLTLPDPLDLAAIDCLREYSLFSIKHLNQLSTRLVNYLHERELLSEVRSLSSLQILLP